MKITVQFTEIQTKFLKKAVLKLNANDPGKETTVVDVIRQMLESSWVDFNSMIDALPDTPKQPLKLVK